ncbi:hypothetical protein HGB13_01860 [bacterium]|nr:hypothetical protein [bacterium]
MEKRNIISGFWMLLLFSALGSALEIWLGKTNFMTPEGMQATRSALSSAHSHALCLSFANILYGLSADVLVKGGWARKTSSYMIMIGTIIFPFAFVGEVFIAEQFIFLAPVGGAIFLLGLLVALVGHYTKAK